MSKKAVLNDVNQVTTELFILYKCEKKYKFVKIIITNERKSRSSQFNMNVFCDGTYDFYNKYYLTSHVPNDLAYRCTVIFFLEMPQIFFMYQSVELCYSKELFLRFICLLFMFISMPYVIFAVERKD